ncbi:hypothetical protein BGZ80_003264 [Entomortierella chlamydospora]|uniref:PLC-like phosphodiesterase n=1 Tax=Entomortierella chlamydospora TaxID=101097 RepID=A0A9P6MPE8_9FUNG|nr:hypothetical protein BGZ79_010868 [Entomortierella chlamydospora]KAG0008592.1 hypothetical protein BGZ80_003264 [Entomortierella chlamydospora]
MRTSLIVSVATAFLSSGLLQLTDAEQLCNGYAALCSKTYDQVTYATTHNAYAYTPPGALAVNQDNNIPTQLGDGIRALMLDAYNANVTSDIELCHTSCSLLDAGPLSKVLTQIKTFMDANPNEVITIFWENAQSLTPAHFQTVYDNAGLSKYLYTQAAGNTTWPTLAEMISSGQRLVNYIDHGSDTTVPWLMNEYSYIFETPFELTKADEFPCTIDRPLNQRQQMYVLNHFLSGNVTINGQTFDLPQPGSAATTNGADLVTHVNDCKTTFSQNPSFVAVDFYEKGSVFPVIAQLNNVTWNGKEPTQSATTTSGAASAMSSVNAKTMGMVALVTALGFLTL